MNTGEFEVLREHVDEARDECRTGLETVTSTLHKFREDVTNKIFLQDNRIQRLESDAGRRKATEEQTQTMLSQLKEQNAQQLLNQAVADARRDELFKLIKTAIAIGVPFGISVLGGLVWLIQHVGAK